MLAIATGVLAQTPLPTQFSGVINDYSPSTTVTPMGPWEMRGPWTLTLNAAASTADFSATLTMELSDYTRNPSNIDTTSGTSSRMQHTHHITITGRHSHANSYRRVRSERPGQRLRKMGAQRHFAASTLTVDITGGTSVGFSNITLQFAGGATGSFRIAVDPRRGWQPDHGRDRPGSDAGHHNCRRDAPQFDDQPGLGGAGRQRVDQRFGKLAVSVRGGIGRTTAGPTAVAKQPQSNGRFCKWTGTVPGSAGGDGREGRHFDESRDHVDLPAIG